MEHINNTLQPNTWIEQYADMLFSFALNRTSNVVIAKDLVQDTFLSALKNLSTFKGEVSEKNWLFTILKNKIIDYYRSNARTLSSDINELVEESNSFFDEEENWQPQFRPQQWEIDYTQEIETKEFYEILEMCKQKLTELQSAVFTMKYLDDFDADEICKELGISSSNYWVLIHRAKLQLRHCLEKNWIQN